MRSPRYNSPWWASPIFWVEMFVAANLAFLTVDIGLAHAVNVFEHRAEWVPIIFSPAATLLLLLAVSLGGRDGLGPDESQAGPRVWRRRLSRVIGLAIGWGSVAIGIAGLLWHLNGQFFQEVTLKNLVYTAPFAAPLAYTGLGLLLILDRMVDHRSLEWACWVVLLAAGGFMGNFVLSLADHAQNGFFQPTEWIGVVAGAIGVGFLTAMLVVPESRVLLAMNLVLMVIQVGVGSLGSYLHTRANWNRQTGSLWDTFVYGAPIFAPLLFADLALLAMLGLWAQARYLAAEPLRD
jgi:hypothetical protein